MEVDKIANFATWIFGPHIAGFHRNNALHHGSQACHWSQVTHIQLQKEMLYGQLGKQTRI
jgi:hypothetical protein